MRTRRSCLCASLVALAGCAAVPRGGAGSGYRFPQAFEVTQLVKLSLGRDGARELLASVRRSGDDYDVTLFDPVFASPVLTASIRGTEAREETLARGPRPGDGIRLVELLRDLHEHRYACTAAGVAEASTARVSYRLSQLPSPAAACRFPAVIEVIPRIGLGPRVHVRTIDVSCSPGVPRS